MSNYGLFPGGDSNICVSSKITRQLVRTFSRQFILPPIAFHFLYQRQHFLYRVPFPKVFEFINCQFEPIMAVAPCGASLLMDMSPQLLELALLDIMVNIPLINHRGFMVACSGSSWNALLTETFPNSSYDDYYRFICEICRYASDIQWLMVRKKILSFLQLISSFSSQISKSIFLHKT